MSVSEEITFGKENYQFSLKKNSFSKIFGTLSQMTLGCNHHSAELP